MKKSKQKAVREILAILNFGITEDELRMLFGIKESELPDFLESISGSYTVDEKGHYSFRNSASAECLKSIPYKTFVCPLYLYWKKKGVNAQSLNDFRRNFAEIRSDRITDFINLALDVGEYSDSNYDKRFSVDLYNCIVDMLKELPLNIRKAYFIKTVLKISKIEFMSGFSQQRTLLLQHEALKMITEANISSNDALLYLYAGVNEHFSGLREKGAMLRKKGIEILRKFDYPGLEEEVAPLMVWDYYLLGDLRRTIAHYENIILPLESKNEKNIFSFTYPPVIFSYFFVGETNRALILAQRIYKQAIENNDKMTEVLMHTVIGRVYIYMGDMSKAEEILNESYKESIELDYGWAIYYALFGIALLEYKRGNNKESRDAIEKASQYAKQYGFSPINASPFILDILKSIREYGYKKIEGFDYEEKLKEYISSTNIHMAGAAYRHLAMEEKRPLQGENAAIEMLEKSIMLLEESGDSIEMAKSSIELAKRYLQIGNKDLIKRYANIAWSHLAEKDYDIFPAELVQYVDLEMKASIFEAVLMSHWLELRHIVNAEQLFIRILTNICRDMHMECGVMFSVENGDLRVKCSQNIDTLPGDDPQLLRAEAVAMSVSNSNKIYLNCNDKETPLMSMGIPFIYEGRTVAVLYIDSSLVYNKITQEECDLLMDFASKMSETIVTAMTYSEAEYGEGTEDYVETIDNTTTYCRSTDEKVRFIREQIAKVSATNVAVLISGETGVGKEVFALEVFKNSNYQKAIMKVNCGAIPENLIEAELFGYEKGSFTGAERTKKGYFEAAEGGTVFLDEIGDLPLSAQVKLLRILQEHELMRVGGTTAVKTDFRLIAATNKDLSEEVRKGNFREDLFYRLNVIKLNIPPLRERKKDIPVFSKFFIDKYCKEFDLPHRSIEPESLIKMMNYDWPGNIRELENLIQKSLLLSDGEFVVVEIPKGETLHTEENEIEKDLIKSTNAIKNISVRDFLENGEILTLAEMETKYIQTVLQLCNGKVSGKGGAAEALGMKRTTLIAKMEKLGISNNHF